MPSPPSLVGALLVVAMTLGYAVADRMLAAGSASPATAAHLCGGPSGSTVAEMRSDAERPQ